MMGVGRVLTVKKLLRNCKFYILIERRLLSNFLSLGQFVMMRTKKRSSCKYYAARILSWDPSGLLFTLEWYKGNSYAVNDTPSQKTVSLGIGPVQEAFEEAVFIEQVCLLRV